MCRHLAWLGRPRSLASHCAAAVLMDLPLVQDLQAAKQGRHKLHFDRSLPSRFGVLPRYGDGSQIRWFEASPCYIYHVVNAWEAGTTVVMDVCRMSRPEPRPTRPGPLGKLLGYLRLDARLHRYEFDLATGKFVPSGFALPKGKHRVAWLDEN